MIGWDDLSKEEQTTLKRMNRGHCRELTEEMAARLKSLGLAQERPDGAGISRAGRELVIKTLLEGRNGAVESAK